MLIKNPQFYSDLAEILAILPTHGLITLTKFDDDRTKIVDFLSLVYFWFSEIVLIQSLVEPGLIQVKRHMELRKKIPR